MSVCGSDLFVVKGVFLVLLWVNDDLVLWNIWLGRSIVNGLIDDWLLISGLLVGRLLVARIARLLSIGSWIVLDEETVSSLIVVSRGRILWSLLVFLLLLINRSLFIDLPAGLGLGSLIGLLLLSFTLSSVLVTFLVLSGVVSGGFLVLSGLGSTGSLELLEVAVPFGGVVGSLVQHLVGVLLGALSGVSVGFLGHDVGEDVVVGVVLGTDAFSSGVDLSVDLVQVLGSVS